MIAIALGKHMKRIIYKSIIKGIYYIENTLCREYVIEKIYCRKNILYIILY